MEVAIIDWENIDSRFVKDELYEHINAPKWVDFSAPDDAVDDEAWFCRHGCDHPKTAEDFFNEKARTPLSNSKIKRSASVSDIPPFGDKNKRDATLKKRGVNQPFGLSNKDSKYYRVVEDGENQDPNFSTPPNHKAKAGKEAIKSSTEKRQTHGTAVKEERTPKLRSTLSARNLFAGGDLLNKVAEFCNELKKLATRTHNKENGDDADDRNVEKQGFRGYMDGNLGAMSDKEKERKPLLEMSNGKSEVKEMSGSKGQLRRKKRFDDTENTPISVDVKNIKSQAAAGTLPIRTSPPTPQCFSAGNGHSKATAPRPFRARPLNQERGILQEVKQINKDITEVEKEEKTTSHRATVVEKEARTLDVFWFLKPCTLSS